MLRAATEGPVRILVPLVTSSELLDFVVETLAKVQEALKDAAAFKAIKEGLKGAEDKVLMKPTEGMSDDDIKGLVTYMRAFKK